MNWYYYLNFKIYKFYENRDNIPVFYSFMATTVLLYFNISSIIVIVGFFQPNIKRFLTKENSLILMALIGFVNYLLLYKGRRYKEVFNYFELFSASLKNWDLSVKLYLIISGCVLLGVLLISDFRNHGHL